MTPDERACLVRGLSRADRAALRAELDAADLREAVAEVIASIRPASPALSLVTDRGTYSVAEAAEYLQCSTDQVYQLIHAGELRAARPGKGFVIRHEELEAYLIEREGLADARRIELGASKRGRNNTEARAATRAS